MSQPAAEIPADVHRIYLSGPMTGLPESNYPAFRAAAADLRARGYDVYDPSEWPERNGLTVEEFDLRAAFADYTRYISTDADAVAVLPGWEHSTGAGAEVGLARALGLPILDAETLHPVDQPPPRPDLTVVPSPAPSSPSGEVRTTSATGGQKGAKEARFSLIPHGPLWELAVLYGRGAHKYAPDNWKKGYDWSLSYDALKRHLELWWSRAEDHDPELGVKHLINVAWHAFNLAWFMENRPEFDDRPNGIAEAGETYEGALPTPQWILDQQAEAARAA